METKHSSGIMRADGARVVNDSQHLIALMGSDADAERMALAWNCHDEMLEALKDLTDRVDLVLYASYVGSDRIAAARAAIAKAEGR